MNNQQEQSQAKISGKELLKHLQVLECAYGYDMPEKRAEFYIKHLGGKFTESEFSKIINRIIETKPRFPALSDFIEQVDHRRML